MNKSTEPENSAVPDVVGHPPVIYAIGLAAGAALEWLVPTSGLLDGFGSLLGWAGWLLVAFGAGLAFWSFARFFRAGTNIPTHRPVTALVTDGPYRITRNPIYVALTAVALGVALLVPSLWMLAALVPVLVVMNEGVIKREEALLSRLFGADYEAYRARVRRWL